MPYLFWRLLPDDFEKICTRKIHKEHMYQVSYFSTSHKTKIKECLTKQWNMYKIKNWKIKIEKCRIKYTNSLTYETNCFSLKKIVVDLGQLLMSLIKIWRIIEKSAPYINSTRLLGGRVQETPNPFEMELTMQTNEIHPNAVHTRGPFRTFRLLSFCRIKNMK